MPYEIKKSGDKFIVYNKNTGKTKGTHPSKKKAVAHIAALEIATKGK